MPCRFRLIRFRSPLLTESLLFSLPRGTEMVHFPRFAPLPYFIQAVVHEYCSCGFPHSEICGSKDACSLPQLIAACHVLHRLEVPRHPPCALSSLTVKLTREQRSRENLSVILACTATCLVTVAIQLSKNKTYFRRSVETSALNRPAFDVQAEHLVADV
jgi:hypothetical protein